MKSSRANARATSAADARVLAALFMGVIAGALVAMLTRRPVPVMEPGDCPICPACSDKSHDDVAASSSSSFDVGSSHPSLDCSKCPKTASTAVVSSSSSSGNAKLGDTGNLPGQWWTPHTAPAATGSEAGDPTLRAILEKVAIDGEVLVAVSNHALINAEGDYGMLRTWLDGVQHAGVKNYLVVAIDDQIAATLKKLGVPHWHREPKVGGIRRLVGRIVGWLE